MFADCSRITTLTLPTSITTIGEHAFECEYPGSMLSGHTTVTDARMCAQTCGEKSLAIPQSPTCAPIGTHNRDGRSLRVYCGEISLVISVAPQCGSKGMGPLSVRVNPGTVAHSRSYRSVTHLVVVAGFTAGSSQCALGPVSPVYMSRVLDRPDCSIQIDNQNQYNNQHQTNN